MFDSGVTPNRLMCKTDGTKSMILLQRGLEWDSAPKQNLDIQEPSPTTTKLEWGVVGKLKRGTLAMECKIVHTVIVDAKGGSVTEATQTVDVRVEPPR